MTREAAAAYFASLGFTHITVASLHALASKPAADGPRYFRFGRLTYYSKASLDSWLQGQIEKAEQKAAEKNAPKKRDRAA
ncbi:hypothetical protein EOD42_14475 [Rhodovarius crocodyli]|uniref:Uncharacterized protein n=1 Tax=Rhodovarius crocodyli TaxID=1979269 RepID=A0A437MFA7_9PROT|nr:hypothetical protein [Rhodovarius crocodyli]RVT96312.1 hypothetical protein EOD42_14475 [Rhodovarius crocodyli]